MTRHSIVRDAILAAFVVVLFWWTGNAHAQEGITGKKIAPDVAKIDSISGALLQKKSQKWLPVKEGEKILSETTLVSFPKTQLHSANGAVEMLMLSDIGKRGVYPILETAVVLKRSPEVDLDVTFQRGLIVLTNQKKEGAAKVRLRVRDAVWELTLQEPGTKVVTELYNQHKPGLPLLADLKTKGPLAHVVILVVNGKAFVDTGDVGLGLSAPPGQSLLFWDNEHRQPLVQKLDKLPEQIRAADKKEAAIIEQINTCVSCLMSREIGPALDDLVKSKNRVDRLVGVTMMGAVDDLPRLVDALADPKHEEVRDHAILVLRNWMGREPGQVKDVYFTLVKGKNYSRIHALTILQLLFGFNDEQKGDPRSYQLLINYLNHSQLPVRQLAHWHLVRLAPSGKDIPYNAAAGAEQRLRAVQQWQKEIPPGKLPPAPKKNQEEK